ncbi:MAG: transcriptional regulator, TetR family [Patescibacteria group bacterium]|nr:transcriptional regulator, TetR family [Patescibacteria group bacterium]
MVYEASTALRHTPKQTRGQRKVEHILRNAEALFAEVGFENATTNAIATRAGVSIGSLYQFFSSKESILEAMADRYLRQMRGSLSEALATPRATELEGLLDNLLGIIIVLQEQRPYFLQCLAYSRPSPVLTPAVDELSDAVVDQVLALLKRGTIEHDPAVLRLRARICTQTISALLPVALHARGRDRARAIEEIKLILMRYLEPTLKVRGML